MERLTERNDKGIAFLKKVHKDEQEIDGSYSTLKCIFECMQRLAAYEDTKLTPERVAELTQAERDGRLMVLPRILSTSRINYLQGIIASQVEYAEDETALRQEANDETECN